MFAKSISRAFFYGNNISRKHGQKCCPYNQNGKPLSQHKVDEFLNNQGAVKWWRVNDEYTHLTRSYYL